MMNGTCPTHPYWLHDLAKIEAIEFLFSQHRVFLKHEKFFILLVSQWLSLVQQPKTLLFLQMISIQSAFLFILHLISPFFRLAATFSSSASQNRKKMHVKKLDGKVPDGVRRCQQTRTWWNNISKLSRPCPKLFAPYGNHINRPFPKKKFPIWKNTKCWEGAKNWFKFI